MTRNSFKKFATASVIALVGIGAPTAAVLASDGDAPAANPGRAARSADRAEQELGRGRGERALRFAEEAVSYSPNDAEYRTLLGQSYLANGRFASAEQSFADARALGANDSRTIIGHALTLLANGQQADALTLIDANASNIPASDYGLALALAGQAERGALVLTDVVRAGGASARDRQNLALSYALAGRWLEARLLAGQDLTGDRLTERLSQWSHMAQSADSRQRIASIMGTTVHEDDGLPVRLALAGSQPRQMAMATPSMNDPAPVSQFAPPPPSDGAAMVDQMLADAAPATAAPQSAPAQMASNEAPMPLDLPSATPVAPVAEMAAADMPAAEPMEMAMASEPSQGAISFYSNPVIQPIRAVVAMVAPLAHATPARARAAAPRAAATPRATAAPRAAAPAPAATPATAPATGARASGWAIQLGAFATLNGAQSGWTTATRGTTALANRTGISTSATVGGRTVYRLAATGFESRAAAQSVCVTMQRAGGTCFVRQMSGESVRWASRATTTRIASR